MDVKEAVKLSLGYIADLFSADNLTNIGLEEVEFDMNESQWIVTIGFSRPWDYPQNALAAITQSNGIKRAYKVVKINNHNGEILSVKNRE